ncbi:MAG: gfo/Idh/MocA family oxidoreductase, partial [Mesorhizobium sp.]
PRASGDLALHVLEIMEAILASGESRESVAVNTKVDQPPLLREDEAASLLA